MSQKKPEKLTAITTLEKTRQQQLLVQVEGKLTESQLEAIAAGAIQLN